MGVNRREQVQREASPVHLFKKLSHTATVVMLETEAIANESFKVMLAPIPMNNLIDANDARDCLQLVADKLDATPARRRSARQMTRPEPAARRWPTPLLVRPDARRRRRSSGAQ